MAMNNPFEKLSPPPGGVEGLRRKLGALENRNSLFSGWQLPRMAAAGVVASLLLIIGYNVLSLQAPPARDYGIFQKYMETPPAEAVSLVGTESARLRLVQQPVGNPAVKMYWIEEVED